MSYKAFQNPAYKYINPGKDAPIANRRTLEKRAREFKDISLSFTPHPITKDVTIVRNERAINNSIRNLIMYMFGEIPFQGDIGSNVRRYMFEVMDDATASFVEDEIERVIEDYEPRVKIKGEINNLPYTRGATTQTASYVPDVSSNINDGFSTFNQTVKHNGDYLGAYVVADPDANRLEVTVTYQIVGYNQVFTINHILYPTRV